MGTGFQFCRTTRVLEVTVVMGAQQCDGTDTPELCNRT